MAFKNVEKDYSIAELSEMIETLHEALIKKIDNCDFVRDSEFSVIRKGFTDLADDMNARIRKISEEIVNQGGALSELESRADVLRNEVTTALLTGEAPAKGVKDDLKKLDAQIMEIRENIDTLERSKSNIHIAFRDRIAEQEKAYKEYLKIHSAVSIERGKCWELVDHIQDIFDDVEMNRGFGVPACIDPSNLWAKETLERMSGRKQPRYYSEDKKAFV